MWFYPAVNSDWETQGNWFTNAGHTIPATGLPGAFTDVVLLADANVHTYGPNNDGFATTTQLGSTLDVNGFTLYITGHPLVETDAWLELTEEQQNDQLVGDVEVVVPQYDCGDTVTVDITNVTDSQAATRQVDEFGFAYAIVIPSGHLNVVQNVG